MPPPFTLIKKHPKGVWPCSICAEDRKTVGSDNSRPWRLNTGGMVCKTCIERPFEDAIQFDTSYPARWGDVILNVDDFTSLWPDGEFIAKYKTKGQRLTSERSKLTEEKLAALVPEGLVLGEDFMYCPEPDFHEPIMLLSGCNQITCRCGGSFCYLCGEKAKGDSLHWREGGCPRNGRPGSEDESYDYEFDAVLSGPVEWDLEITFETWVCNVTMQNAGEATQRLQQRLLGRRGWAAGRAPEYSGA
jgi:hypothetical protein